MSVYHVYACSECEPLDDVQQGLKVYPVQKDIPIEAQCGSWKTVNEDFRGRLKGCGEAPIRTICAEGGIAAVVAV